MFHIYPYPHPVHFGENWNNDRLFNTTSASTTASVSIPQQQQQQQQSQNETSQSGTTTGVTTPQQQQQGKLLELGPPTSLDPLPLPNFYAIDEKPNLAHVHQEFGTDPSCNAQIPSNDLINQLRNSMGKKRCDVCNYEAPTKHHLREHMNTHTGLKPYKCTYCDKSFAAKNSLRVHTMYLHTKIRQHQCHFCEQRFVTTSERKSHELVHTDKCPVCSQGFRLRGHLRQHMKVHSGGGGGNYRNKR